MARLIPEEELRSHRPMNLAPMVDFLFLTLAVFIVLAISRSGALYDSEISLVKLRSQKGQKTQKATAEAPMHTIYLSINERGDYKWITEFNEYLIEDPGAIVRELKRQQREGLIPKNREQLRVHLHIDKNAKWQSIIQAIVTVREAGFLITPVYEPAQT